MSPAVAAAWEGFLAAAPPGEYAPGQRDCLAELVEATGPDFVGELLDDLCRDGAARLAAIAGAARAGDAEGTARGAHTLKSMGRALGFERLGAHCARIEEAVRAGDLAGVAPHVAALRGELARAERLRENWNR